MSEPIILPNGRKIGLGEPCFIVAEIGQNHQGDVYTALRLIKTAVEAGCDAVKLTKRHLPSDMTAAMRDAPYDNPHSFGATYGQHREALELTAAEYRHLQLRIKYNTWNVILFATVCDIPSAGQIRSFIDPPLYKIASRDLDNIPLIDYVAAFGKPLILSTGMARPGDLEAAIAVAMHHGIPVIVLYCISQYPTADIHVDLRRLQDLQERHGCLIGFSDHTVGIPLAQAAAQAGAVMIEKHITLARAQKGSDHAASLEPQGLALMVRNIRLVERSLGIGAEPEPVPPLSIEATRCKLGRSLTTRRDIPAGSLINSTDMCLKSPGWGCGWHDRDRIIGKQARRFLAKDTTITPKDVQDVEEADGGN